MIPFVNLAAQRDAYREELDAAIAEVLDSGCLIGGSVVRRLEAELCLYSGVREVVSCASGTSALALALKALELRPGDEVVLPDFTFVATADAVALLGGVPRFADIGEDFLISPASVLSRIGPKTVGIIAVDLFGQCADYGALRDIAKERGLWVLEDAAQSFGAKQGAKFAGTLANIAATSFYPTKPFGAYGDGGAVLSDDKTIAEKVRTLAHHGSLERGEYEIIGTNSRLDAMQAAVLLVKLKHLDPELDLRRKNAAVYDKLFKTIPGIRVPQVHEKNESVFAQYTLRIDERDSWKTRMERAGVPTCLYYPRPLSAEKCFSRFPTATKDGEANETAKKMASEVLSIPVSAFTDIQGIVERIRRA